MKVTDFVNQVFFPRVVAADVHMELVENLFRQESDAHRVQPAFTSMQVTSSC